MLQSYQSHRRYLILNLINHLGPISRTSLSELTDYRPASIGSITKQLLEEGLLVEAGNFSTGHGRKRALLDINKSYLCALGIGFRPSEIICITADLNGDILERAVAGVPPERPKEAVAREIVELASRAVAQHVDKEIVGIGLSDPLYDPTHYKEASAQASYAHFNDWIHFDLKPGLEKRTGLPVRTFSAVTLPALVEQRFGAAKGIDDFLCVELSNGIGASICCNGTVVAGANGVAGELGHTVIDMSDPGPRLCYCGKAGCVERTTAFPALASDISRALEQGVSSVLNTFYDRGRELTVDDIRKALDEGDQLCRYYVKRSAVRIGTAIANAVDLLNPKLVVLYGFMLELGEYFLRQMEQSIRENVLSISQDFAIRTSPALEQMLPLGAAAELFSSYLRMEDYKWVYQLRTGGMDRQEPPVNEEGRP